MTGSEMTSGGGIAPHQQGVLLVAALPTGYAPIAAAAGAAAARPVPFAIGASPYAPAAVRLPAQAGVLPRPRPLLEQPLDGQWVLPPWGYGFRDDASAGAAGRGLVPTGGIAERGGPAYAAHAVPAAPAALAGCGCGLGALRRGSGYLAGLGLLPDLGGAFASFSDQSAAAADPRVAGMRRISSHLLAAYQAITSPGGSTVGSAARGQVLAQVAALRAIAADGAAPADVRDEAKHSAALVHSAAELGAIEKQWDRERAAIEQIHVRRAYVDNVVRGQEAAFAAARAADRDHNVSLLHKKASEREDDRVANDCDPAQVVNGELTASQYAERCIPVPSSDAIVSTGLKVAGAILALGALGAALALRRPRAVPGR